MKSPPVEDMFAELSSEDGEDYVVPRRNRAKIYYSRDQLLALKNSPLVKEPRGMSPASEWFTPSTVESHPPGYRSRQSPFFGETGRDAILTPGKNTKRGNGRLPGENYDGEERLSFGRGLASSGRPRNLTRRTDSGTLGRSQTAQDEHPDPITPERRTFDRTERKDRLWAKTDLKDASEGDATIMGRFAMKGALKLQTGDEIDRRTSKQVDGRVQREFRSADHSSKRTADSTWRRTTSGQVDGAAVATPRRYGHNEDEHVPEWMMDPAPTAIDATHSKQSQAGSTQSGLDEIAAYRQAMKEREERLAASIAQPGRLQDDIADRAEHQPPGLFSDLSSSHNAGSGSHPEQRTTPASFLLPQAKAKVRNDNLAASVSDPATPSGKGSRFARFFDPSASPATAHTAPIPQQTIPPAHTTRQEPVETLVDKAQGLAALLGIRPASLVKAKDAVPQSPVISTNSQATPPTPPTLGMPPIREANIDPATQSVDHMARLLGMLKTAQTAQPPSLPATPSATARSAPTAPISPNSGSRFLAAMLNGEKPKHSSSPIPPSTSLSHHDGRTAQRQLGTEMIHEPSNQATGTQVKLHGARLAQQPSEHHMAEATPTLPHERRMPAANIPRDMESPSMHFAATHVRPPGMDMMPNAPTSLMYPPQQIRPNISEMTPAIQQQAQFWQLAGELPRGPPPPRGMPMPGPPFPPMNMPPPPVYGPYPIQNLPPGPGMPHMHPHHPMGFGGHMPPGPPPHTMTPDAMSSNLMALLQNRPQA